MKLRGLWLGVLLLAATVSRAQTDVLVSHYDAARTGQNLNEPTLTVPNLSATTFGKVYAFALDGYTYAQPLYKSNLTLPGLGTFNVVFAATEHGSVYALDADSATPLWQRSFINPAAGLTTRTTNPALEDIVPEVSITSTPVIDAASGTLYVVAETVQSGSPALFWLHALDITTGADKVPPVSLQASAGSGAGFHVDAPTSEQRPGLFLVNGVVYVGLGSSGDSFPWVGWLLGYNATTLAQVSVFCTSGAGAQGAGVWGSGEAPAVDASGNIFFSTGNGYFSSGSNAWADTFLKLKTAGGLAVLDYFAPFNVAALGLADLDVAAAGIVLLPDAAGSAAHPHLLVGSGKDGEIYLIDRDNMGHFNGSYNTPNSNVVQWIPGQIGTVPVDPTAMPMPYAGNSFTTPAYWQNHVYFCGAKDVCKAFTLANGLLSTTPTSQAPGSFGYPGSQPVISAASSSATSAVLWTIERDSVNNASTLHAYDATNLANEVYNSNQASGSRDRGGPPIKFAVPTVANGKVFVGAQYELDVYGMLGSSGTRLAAPVFTPGAGSYSAPQAVTITAAAGATIHYTLDGSPPTLASATYVNPIPVTAAATVRAIAVKGGALTSPAASASYTIAPPPPQIAFVQGNYATPQTAQAGVSVRYTAMQSAGDLNVVIVGWGDTTATVQSVTDTSGNAYVRAVGPTLMTGTLSQSIYYAKNILAPGANTVSVSFSAPAVYPDIRILEYRGLDPANPLDVVAAAVGNNATPNSGAATTTAANELIVGADLTTGATVAAGSGFTSRMITVPDADIAEDQVVASTGSYAATASAPGGPWLMQMATFRAAGAGAPATPSAPGTLTASAAGVTAVNLSWGAATETGGTIAQYLIERCQGAGCSNFAQIGTASAPTTSFADSGLTGSSSYSYRVRAKDASGNTGPYSNSATAVTAAATPGAPAALAASAAGSAQINLTWSAATETGGTIAQYLIERCQGTGCSSFTQVGTATTLAFSDTGLSASTAYSYRVRAKDTVGTTGPYSNVASASTAAATPTISAPGALTASATSATQVDAQLGRGHRNRRHPEPVPDRALPGRRLQQLHAGRDGERAEHHLCRHRVDAARPATATACAPRTRPAIPARTRTSPPRRPGPWRRRSVPRGRSAPAPPAPPRSRSAGARRPKPAAPEPVPDRALPGRRLQQLHAGRDGERAEHHLCRHRVERLDQLQLPRARQGHGRQYRPVLERRLRDDRDRGADDQCPGDAQRRRHQRHPDRSQLGRGDRNRRHLSQYLIERCQGAGCSSFTQVGTTAVPGTTFTDSGLTAGTSYSYRVRAQDTAGNTGPYSNTATRSRSRGAPSAPTGLTASAASSTQVNLSWAAATETRRQHRAVPDRALPGRRLQQLHAGRDRDAAELQRQRAQRLDGLQLSGACQGCGRQYRAVLECRHRHHRRPHAHRPHGACGQQREQHPDQSHLGRRVRDRRGHQPVPHRALPGHRLQHLRAGRHRHRHELQRRRADRRDRVFLPRARGRCRRQHRAVLEPRQRHDGERGRWRRRSHHLRADQQRDPADPAAHA